MKTFTESPDRLGAYGPVMTEDGRRLEIAQLRVVKPDEAVVRFSGVSDRNIAETLKGVQLYVPRAALPEPDGGTFYFADLVGLSAQDSAGNAFGTVAAVHNFGAGDVIEVVLVEGGSEFVPFTSTHVPVVDVAGGRIVVELPRDTDA